MSYYTKKVDLYIIRKETKVQSVGGSVQVGRCVYVCVLGSVRLQCSVLVMAWVWADESACISARYAAEVCERHGHLGSRDAVCVVDERVGEAHPEAFGGTLALLATAHAELRPIQSRVEDTKAAGVATCSVAQSSLIVSQRSTVECLQRGEVRRV